MTPDHKLEESTQGLLPDEDDHCPCCKARELRRHRRSAALKRYAKPVLATLLILCIAIPILWWQVLAYLDAGYAHGANGHVFKHRCGDTLEEAIANGCTFDELSVLWLPPQCSRGSAAEYTETGPWTFWHVDNGHAGAVVQNLSQIVGTGTFYTTTREHLSHCAHMLLRGSKALDDGRLLDPLTMSANHAKHCASMLLEHAMKSPDGDELNIADVGLGAC